MLSSISAKPALTILLVCLAIGGIRRSEARECNGWHTAWCQDHYTAEINPLGATIRAEEARLLELPPLMEAERNAINSREQLYSSFETQRTMLQQRADSANQQAGRLRNLMESATAAQNTLRNLSPEVRQAIPLIIVRLRDYLAGREALIADRIGQINLRLAQEIPAAEGNALAFERRRLLEIQTMSIEHGSASAAQAAINQAFTERNAADLPLLSPETQALLRVAHEAGDAYSGDELARTNLERQLGAIQASATDLYQTNLVEVTQLLARVRLLAAAQEDRLRELNAHRATLADLTRQRDITLPQSIAAHHNRFDRADLYRHCCDNHPACDFLPDADQNSTMYAQYETVVDFNPSYCRNGPDR